MLLDALQLLLRIPILIVELLLRETGRLIVEVRAGGELSTAVEFLAIPVDDFVPGSLNVRDIPGVDRHLPGGGR